MIESFDIYIENTLSWRVLHYKKISLGGGHCHPYNWKKSWHRYRYPSLLVSFLADFSMKKKIWFSKLHLFNYDNYFISITFDEKVCLQYLFLKTTKLLCHSARLKINNRNRQNLQWSYRVPFYVHINIIWYIIIIIHDYFFSGVKIFRFFSCLNKKYKIRHDHWPMTIERRWSALAHMYIVHCTWNCIERTLGFPAVSLKPV